MFPVCLSATFRAVSHAWDSAQVELHGRYSLHRLNEILTHAKSSSWLGNCLTVAVVPLPPLLIILAIDVLPMHPPQVPFSQQTVWLTFRACCIAGIFGFVTSMQMHQSAPSLPFSTWQLIVATVVPAIVIGAFFCLIGAAIGFPAPFLIQVLTVPWCVAFAPILYYFWKDTLRTDPEAKRNIVRYIQVFNVQLVILTSYTGYYTAFTCVHQSYKTYVSFLLPVLKLPFKNWASRGVFHLEDLAPSTVVFNVDAFHVVFVAMTTQASSSRATTGFIMGVDVVQSAIALWEVHLVVRRARRLICAIESTQSGREAAVLSGREQPTPRTEEVEARRDDGQAIDRRSVSSTPILAS